MICALLIFQTPDLPDRLWRLSPWLDDMGWPPELGYAELAAQRHRRFVKTHAPLDGIPVDPSVTYIVTARHPLDTYVSLCYHAAIPQPGTPPPGPPAGGRHPGRPHPSVRHPGGPHPGGPHPGGPPPDPPPGGFRPPPGFPPSGFGPPPGGSGPPPGGSGPPPGGFGSPPGGSGPPPGGSGPPPGGFGPPPGGSPGRPHEGFGPPPDAPTAPSPRTAQPPISREALHDAVLTWIADDDHARRDPNSLASVLRHLSDAWARRDEPNVLLVRYEDLLADLAGQMRWLAGRLGIAVPEPAWPGLVEAATFERMKDRADFLVQVPPWVPADRAPFFRRGSSGAGREVLSDEEMAAYYARAAELAPSDVLDWLHSPPTPAG